MKKSTALFSAVLFFYLLLSCLPAVGIPAGAIPWARATAPLAALASPGMQAVSWNLQEGDILFQETKSSQAKALFLATGSRYTHCGIVLKKDGVLHVLEAVQPVTWTTIPQWVARNDRGHFLVYRLKDTKALLSPAALERMRAQALPLLGRDYDLLFQWSDEAVYCSELVWKLYDRALGLQLVPLKTFADYNLDHRMVQQLIRQRYGTAFNMNERVVAPSDLMQSPLLERVGEYGEPSI